MANRPINNHRIMAKLAAGAMAMTMLSAAQAEVAEDGSADNGGPRLTIADYEQSSFAPARGETFAIPLQISDRENLQALTVEIRSSDDDLITNIQVPVDSEQPRSQAVWDGKDAEGTLVPDEAYVPVLVVREKGGKQYRIDPRANSGGEEVYDFDKHIGNGSIEYTLPAPARMLIRAGIKNGPMLSTVLDWRPRTAGFHAERWSGRDADDLIAIQENPQVGYLIIGYQLPRHGIITYGNAEQSYRDYRAAKAWALKQTDYANQPLERNGKLIRPESYTPVLQQQSPRIAVTLLEADSREPLDTAQGFDDIITKVQIHSDDEIYLDQERYEISFFVDNEFIAEEEQGFVPFSWRWSPARFGIEPGKHIMTVNVSGYRGQVGVRNLAFTLEAVAETEATEVSGSISSND